MTDRPSGAIALVQRRPYPVPSALHPLTVRTDPVFTRHLAIAAALAALLAPAGLAQAQDNERQEMLRGGATKKGVYNIFGLDGTGLGRTTVSYQSQYKPGTIVVDTAKRELFLIQDGGSALRYGIGVGRAGFQWKGTHKITRKKENPDWTPPPEMIAQQPEIGRAHV